MRLSRFFAIIGLLLLLALISVIADRTQVSLEEPQASASPTASLSPSNAAISPEASAEVDTIAAPEGDVILWEGGFGCRGGGPDYRSDWVKTDHGYVCGEKTLGSKELERLRSVILASRESPNPLTEFGELPTGRDLSKLLTDTYPWVVAEPPSFDSLELKREIESAVNGRGGSTIGDYVDIQIKGEPEISAMFSQSVTFFGPGRLPTWTIRVGDEEWETQSPRIIRELSPWSEESNGPVAVHQDWLKRVMDSEVRDEAVPWIEEYLRQEAPTWSGADKFDISVISDSVPYRHQGHLRLTPRFPCAFETVELQFDFVRGLPANWVWLDIEIRRADQQVGNSSRFGNSHGVWEVKNEGRVLKVLWSDESQS